MPKQGQYKTLKDHMAKVQINEQTGCWLWTGVILRHGYGQLRAENIRWSAHRYFYTKLVGEISDGLDLDHLCHTNDPTCRDDSACLHRRCVNPTHLEPVTERENSLRGRSIVSVNAQKTSCLRGHPFDETNTAITPKGGRVCRECKRLERLNPGRSEHKNEYRRKWRARRKLAGLPAT